MAISEARKRANKKWNDANMIHRYDRIQLVVPKGQKVAIQAHAESKGLSTNGLVNELLKADMGLEEWPEVKE